MPEPIASFITFINFLGYNINKDKYNYLFINYVLLSFDFFLTVEKFDKMFSIK